MRWMATCVLGLAVVGLGGAVADAAPIIISQPGDPIQPGSTTSYVNGTTKIDISGLQVFSLVDSVTNGILTATFDTSGFGGKLSVRQADSSFGGGWGSDWSAPPFSETTNPRVLFNEVGILTINLSTSVEIFGFELESDSGGDTPFQADYYDSTGKLIGTVGPLEIGNEEAARLIALNGMGELFNRIVIRSGPGSTNNPGFAIAQLRYGFNQLIDPPTTVPEPASATLWTFVALIGAGSLARRKLRHKQSHSQPRTTPA
jgi:hypothetical protein